MQESNAPYKNIDVSMLQQNSKQLIKHNYFLLINLLLGHE